MIVSALHLSRISRHLFVVMVKPTPAGTKRRFGCVRHCTNQGRRPVADDMGFRPHASRYKRRSTVTFPTSSPYLRSTLYCDAVDLRGFQRQGFIALTRKGIATRKPWPRGHKSTSPWPQAPGHEPHDILGGPTLGSTGPFDAGSICSLRSLMMG